MDGVLLTASLDDPSRSTMHEHDEHDERLAAYAAGELDADAAAALEAAIARDPVLRARLAAIRRADQALESLPDVEPPRGFEGRLRAALRGPVSEQLEDAGSSEVQHLPARRRLSDRLPDWMPALAGVAAGLALLGGLGYAVLQSGGGTEQMAGGDAAPETAAGQRLETDTESAEPVRGPLVLATGRSYDEAGLAELAGDPVVGADADRELAEAPPEVVARRYADQLGIASFSARATGDGLDTDESAQEGRAHPTPGATGEALDAPGVSDADLADVRRCVTTLLDGADADDDGAPPIPTYAELASFDGRPVVVAGLVTRDPDRSTRNEVWVLDRSDCQVRYFTQSD